MKNFKYVKTVKRLEALFLAVFLAVSGSFSQALAIRSYAAEAQGAVTAWEVLQLLLMSAGVTIQTASGTNEASDDDSYLATMSCMRKSMDAEYVDDIEYTINTAIARGSGATALTVSFVQDTWDALKDWVYEKALDGTSFVVDDSVSLVFESNAGHFYINEEIYSVSSGKSESVDYDFYCFDDDYYYFLYRYSSDVNGSSMLRLCGYNLTDDTFKYFSQYQDASASYVGYNYFLDFRTSSQNYYICNSFVSNMCILHGNEALFRDFLLNGNSDCATYIPGSAAEAESLGLISDVFYAEILDKVFDVLTPHRVLTDEGAIVGNMTLTIPRTMAVADSIAAVREGTLPITDVLAQVGVIPIDMTKKKAIAEDKTIDEAIEAVEAATEYNQYTVDLTGIFPFCIPFDLIHFLQVLDADPVAPCFEIPFVVEALGIDMTVELDMSFMEGAMKVFRIGELGCFVIGLMLVTSKVIRW